jgi:hypothetical protein
MNTSEFITSKYNNLFRLCITLDIMADITGGLTKRLSFGEVSTYLNATQHVEVEDVIKALKNPSVDGFER